MKINWLTGESRKKQLWQKRWEVGTGGPEQIHLKFIQQFVQKTGI